MYINSHSLAWHPTHERLFASGGGDGALAFWGVGTGNTPRVIIRCEYITYTYIHRERELYEKEKKKEGRRSEQLVQTSLF
jgi:hypothetical protein